jgi:adenylosuccinate synthase
VDEAQLGRMQGHPPRPRVVFHGGFAGSGIDPLAADGMATFGHVDPDLVGATGFEATLDERVGIAEMFHGSDMGDRPLAGGFRRRAPATIPAVAEQVRDDGAGFHAADHQSQIAAVGGMESKLLGKNPACRHRAGEDYQAARFTIDSMHGPDRTGASRGLAAADPLAAFCPAGQKSADHIGQHLVQRRLHLSPASRPGRLFMVARRSDARGLVDDHDILIEVDDPYILRPGRRGGGVVEYFHHVARFEPPGRVGAEIAMNGHVSRPHELLDGGPACPLQTAAKVGGERLPDVFGLNVMQCSAAGLHRRSGWLSGAGARQLRQTSTRHPCIRRLLGAARLGCSRVRRAILDRISHGFRLCGEVPRQPPVSLFHREDFSVPGTCVIGLQWGDEAKGKLVDILTEDHEIVVRYQGGANAGHTVVSAGQTWKLSLIPSGILRDGVTCVVTGGVVLDPASVIDEIDGLESRGVGVAGKLLLSDRAHVVFPWHIAEDAILNASLSGGEAIGTTGRGIGPCYRDKVGRSLAIRLGDLYRPDFRAKLDHIVAVKNRFLAATAGEAQPPLDAAAIFDRYASYAARLQPCVCDTTAYLLDAAEAGKKLLFEGAQGALLDIDHGTFPFVTSSNSSGVGVSSGSGIPARWIDRVIGVVKAYSTRVGGGPLPTEQENWIGQHLRDRGNEYGTVTRRPRRCGWFDAVAARYTARLSGVDELAVMLLDVLGGLEELRVCVAYSIDGRRVEQFPSHIEDLRRAEPIYEAFPGWEQDLTGVRSFADLPENARRYLAGIGDLLGRPVSVTSVGPDRSQTILCEPRNLRTSWPRSLQPTVATA